MCSYTIDVGRGKSSSAANPIELIFNIIITTRKLTILIYTMILFWPFFFFFYYPVQRLPWTRFFRMLLNWERLYTSVKRDLNVGHWIKSRNQLCYKRTGKLIYVMIVIIGQIPSWVLFLTMNFRGTFLSAMLVHRHNSDLTTLSFLNVVLNRAFLIQFLYNTWSTDVSEEYFYDRIWKTL